MKIQLKICGMREPANIAEVAMLAPHYMGFIFFEGSSRFTGGMLPAVTEGLPKDIQKTGVFVDAPAEVVLLRVQTFQLDAVQLHGRELPVYCNALKVRLPHLKVIKAFGIDEHFNFDALLPYVDVVDFFLFDTQTPYHGGSGKEFDWTLLSAYQLEVPYFLSGGIGPESIERLQEIRHPQLYAIDVNSRFEIAPGLKEVSKLKDFKLKLFR